MQLFHARIQIFYTAPIADILSETGTLNIPLNNLAQGMPIEMQTRKCFQVTDFLQKKR
jgi:hypothetical protein